MFKDHETSSSSSGGGQELDDAKLAAVDHLIGFHTLEYIPGDQMDGVVIFGGVGGGGVEIDQRMFF